MRETNPTQQAGAPALDRHARKGVEHQGRWTFGDRAFPQKEWRGRVVAERGPRVSESGVLPYDEAKKLAEDFRDSGWSVTLSCVGAPQGDD